MKNEAVMPDAGHIYTGPSYWPREKPWEPHEGRCRAAVRDGGGWPSYHQCHNKVEVERKVQHKGEIVTYGYCNTHDPVKVAAKEAARKAKWEEEWSAKIAARDAAAKAKQDGQDAIDIIQQIAKGHNDPRTACLTFLQERGIALRDREQDDE